MRVAVLLSLALALAGCGESDPQGPDKSIPKAVAAATKSVAAEESEFGTPVKDRVATLGLLNKRNNLTQTLTLKTGEARRIGNVVVRLSSCERTLPWERPAEVGAFVQFFVEERVSADKPLAWRKVFSGWLFKNSPSLNVVEHPVYDVWVKDCAMKFPGEEALPAPAASASSAAKPAGNASPAPAASPAPKPSAAPTPSVAI
jgi:hypothetical protein